MSLKKLNNQLKSSGTHAICGLVRKAFLLLSLFVVGADAAPIIPTVYQDQYVLVRAGINETGRQPIHVGDLLSFELRIQFDSRNVRLERFDSEYFQRGFSTQTGIRLFAPPVVTHENLEASLVETRAIWSFQILDCPADQEICAGDKHYNLPVISTSYQLIDQFSQVLNEKSFRFRPWPEKIVVSPSLPSLPEPESDFADYFPSGAYPEMLLVKTPSYGGLLALVAGSLLLALGLGGRFPATGSLHGKKKMRPTGSRWERLLLHLRDSSLQDEEWTDGLRRCASWFCLDELGVNPYVWLTDDSSSAEISPASTAGARALFTDIVSQCCIEPENRQEYLARFKQIVNEIMASQGPRNKS